MRGLTAGPRVGDSGSFTGRALGTLRATLVAAAVAIPQALAPVTPLAAQSASPLLAPDAPAFDAQRRIHLTRSALYFVPGESESSEEDGVYVLPAPVPWPPDAGARNVTLTVPAGKPLFLLAALAPGATGFSGPPAISLDGISLGNVLPHAVRGVSVSDGAHQQEHAALALVLAPPAPGRHVIELSCGACAPAHGPWLGLMNGAARRYELTVEEPVFTFAQALQISTDSPSGPATSAPEAPATLAPPAASPVPVPPVGAVLERRLYSHSLGRELPYRVYLPSGYDQSAPPETQRRYPVLYLLHGLGGGIQQWSRLGLEAELDRQNAQAIVVTPAGRAGYWVNHADGGPRWADYLLNDVVGHIDATYRTVAQRQARAIGGLSMGGHGALQLALNNSNSFGVVGAHSPALRTRDQAPHFLGGLLMAASPTAIPPQAYAARDPVSLALRPLSTPPALWIDTAQNDPWRSRAEELRVALRLNSVPHAWSVEPGGHDGLYWTRRLPEYIRFYREQLGA